MRIVATTSKSKQRGAAAVEFALIAVFFFAVLFGIVEFGRALFVWNSVQEVTRYVARESVVCWQSDWNSMRDARGMLGLQALPAAPEFTSANVTIEPLRRADMAVLTGANLPPTVDENSGNCVKTD
ncbi:MAG TPA: TadE family protein, partial [Gallionella sp.]|nr:TadE family protein [Gallionella sp.]